MRVRLWLLLVLSAGACVPMGASPAVAPTSPAASSCARAATADDVNLPSARNGLEWSPDYPSVRVREGKVLYEGKMVDDVGTIPPNGAPRRLDGLFAALKA